MQAEESQQGNKEEKGRKGNIGEGGGGKEESFEDI